VNALLGVLVLALVAYLLVLLAGGAKAVPGTTRGERAQQRYDAVTAAARKEVTAFLRVDHTNMDPLLDAVLDGATGQFKQQYAATRSSLKAAAQQAKATSTGRVKEVGVTELKGRTATVFVAADAVVTNTTTAKNPATAACPHTGAGCRFYRLKVGMAETGDGWKISSLDFVS
jgi:Mce-associated membrane protein